MSPMKAKSLDRAESFETARSTKPTFLPAFLRLPRNGSLCPVTGLSRTALYELCKSGAVKSVVLRRHAGAKRGIRLVNCESLLTFLRSHEQAGFGVAVA